MNLRFDIMGELSALVRKAATAVESLGPAFDPQVRPSTNAAFGDFQANGVLPAAKALGVNPRELAQALVSALPSTDAFTVEIAGPGFLNFRLSPRWLLAWIKTCRNSSVLKSGAGDLLAGRRVVIDFPSANTAKQAHIGHLRPMVIGEAIARLLEFCGADLVRDNHIGDWGTNFGTLIMQIRRSGTPIAHLGEDALALLDQLYKDGSQYEKEHPEAREQSRAELVRLQNGEPESTALWERIVALSNAAFETLFERLGVRVDITLGESFYRDKVDRVYTELQECGLAESSEGALVVWHDEVKKFSRTNERPNPFTIRKSDGASNYASTDLATALYRIEHFKAEEIVYLTDARQQDHFQQLFLTVEKWFKHYGYRLPKMHHVWWGAILGSDKKPIKTKSGESIKLNELLDEAERRAFDLVTAKNPELPEVERQNIARAVGIGGIKYADLSSNRTQDYIFSWERLLSLEGNTAAYLQYAGARIHSIFRKAGISPSDPWLADTASALETPQEHSLARKLASLPSVLSTTLAELRPHYLCTYLYELASELSAFLTENKVLTEEPDVKARRLLLCSRTLCFIETGLHLLGIEHLERM